MTKIIALSGKIGSGKNYISENIIFPYLRSLNLNVVMLAFADDLKVLCYSKDNVSYERLFVNKDTQSRLLLQQRGDEEKKVDNDIFIKMLDCRIKMMVDRKVDIILITDVRYKRELQFLHSKDVITIRINSPQRTINKIKEECKVVKEDMDKILNHSSETDLDNENSFYYIFNNDYENEKQIKKDILNIL